MNLAVRKINTGRDAGFDIAQIEKLCSRADMTIVGPLAAEAVKTKQQRKQGGANSHEMQEHERRERNRLMQKEIDKLCLEKGHSFRSARFIVAEKYSLHPDSLRRILKNPLKLGH